MDSEETAALQNFLLSTCSQLLSLDASSLALSSANPQQHAVVRQAQVIISFLSDGILRLPSQSAVIGRIRDVLFRAMLEGTLYSPYLEGARQREKLFRALEHILSSPFIRGMELNTIIGIFQSCIEALPSPEKDPTEYPITNEETSLAIVQSLAALCKNPYSPMGFLLEDHSFHHLAYAIFVLLNVAKKEKLRELRILAVQTVRNLVESVRERVDFVSHFLPGISSTMAMIICDDFKQGSNVVQEALKTLNSVISIALNDEVCKEIIPLRCSVDNQNTFENLVNLFQDIHLMGKSSSESPNLESTSNISTHLLESSGTTTTTATTDTENEFQVMPAVVSRTTEWFISTQNHMDVLLQRILPVLETHAKWFLRKELASFLETILLRCPSLFYPNLIQCVEGLFKLMFDPISSVRQPVCSFLLLFRDQLSRYSTQNRLHSLLEEAFVGGFQTLRSLVETYNDRAVVKHAQMLRGYAIFMSDTSFQRVLDVSYETTIYETLKKTAQLETIDSHLVEYSTVRDETSQGEGSVGYHAKRFHFLKDSESIEAVANLIETLGRRAADQSLSMLILPISESLDVAGSIKYEAGGDSTLREEFWILNYIFRGAFLMEEMKNEEDNEINAEHQFLNSARETMQRAQIIEHNVSPVLQLLETVVWFLEENPSDESTVPLILEWIGTVAEAFQRQFHQMMFVALYAVLEQSGNVNQSASQRAANATLERIALVCGYSDVSHLLYSNMDYLVDAVTTRLVHIADYPSTPRVVFSLFSYRKLDVESEGQGAAELPFLNDVVKYVLESIDMNYTSPSVDVIDGLLAVLKIIVETLSVDLQRKGPGIFRGDGNEENTEDLYDSVQYVPPQDVVSPLDALLKEAQDFEKVAADNERGFEQEKDAETFFREYHAESEAQESSDLSKAQVNKTDTEKLQAALPYSSTGDSPEGGSLSEMTAASTAVLFLTEIVSRCRAFLYFPSLSSRIVVYEILYHALPGLVVIKSQLFPLIHRVFPSIAHSLVKLAPFVQLGKHHEVNSNNKREFLALLKLIERMGESCGDFVSEPFQDRVLPTLLEVLENFDFHHGDSPSFRVSSDDSRTSNKHIRKEDLKFLESSQRKEASRGLSPHTAFASSSAHRVEILCSIMHTVKTFCVSSTTAIPPHVESLSKAVFPFLSRIEDPRIQKDSISLMIALSQVNGDEMFLIAASLVRWKADSKEIFVQEKNKYGDLFAPIEWRKVQHFYDEYWPLSSSLEKSIKQNARVIFDAIRSKHSIHDQLD